jgi:hypothetical protein
VKIAMATLFDIIDFLLIEVGIITFILLFFVVMMGIRFSKRKSKVALYLFICYLLYFVGLIFIGLAYWVNRPTLSNTPLGNWFNAISLASLILATVAIFFFSTELTDKKKLRWIVLIVGILLATWILLPFDDNYDIVFITFALMGVFNFAVYIPMAIMFFRLARKSDEMKGALLTVGFASIILIIFVVIVSVANILDNGWFLFASNLVLILALTGFYRGFILGK